eukprot:CAMPEP_0202788186 /NCGR_PEP_ID=MMETSP1388-20130828/74188_1 /ASSEMBLY_ACC=CAM_ASM_000864 /TAXON_ID=37098 /ORGANISM="Isochrysis sp, Strain CCMP1244" /LENGTH=135 /DNA_ID=CAMNT_0049457815 /DNA_START=33 /DNA_END=439 /DNA_ORIENTATION=+
MRAQFEHGSVLLHTHGLAPPPARAIARLVRDLAAARVTAVAAQVNDLVRERLAVEVAAVQRREAAGVGEGAALVRVVEHLDGVEARSPRRLEGRLVQLPALEPVGATSAGHEPLKLPMPAHCERSPHVQEDPGAR